MSNLNVCCVCGRGSSRPSWNNTINGVDGNGFTTTFVACDFHSLSDIEAAIIQAGFNPVIGDDNQPISIDESAAS